jgi:anti-sigma factor RsiW
MNCEQTREHLVEYLYGELPPELASEVEAELDHCPACAAQLAEMRRVHELVAALPRLDVPGPVHHDILRQARLSATRERSAARGSFASFFLSPAFATAVVVCLVLGVGILLEQRGARPPSEAPPETAAVRTSSSAIAQQTPAEPVEETVAQAGPTPQASRPQAAVPQDNAAAPTSPVGPSDLGPVAQVEPVRPVEPAPAAAFGARELPSPGPTGQSIVTATPIAHAAAAQHESPPAPDEAEAPAPEVVAQLDQPTSHHARADRNAEIDLERQQGELERQQSEQRRLEAESQGSQRQIRTGDRQGQGGALPAAPEPPRATAAPGFENRTEGTAGVAQQGQATVGGEALADRDHPAAGAPATGTPGSSRAADGSSTSGEATAAPPEQPAAADRSRQAHHAHEDADAEMAAIPEAERPVTEAGEATQAAPVVPEIAAESSGAGRIGTELNEEPSDELSYLYGENEQASPPAEEAGNADQGVAAAQPSSAAAEPSSPTSTPSCRTRREPATCSACPTTIRGRPA